eukprot:Nk52_evm29s1810 gene=Nk52_evmTU29s1810
MEDSDHAFVYTRPGKHDLHGPYPPGDPSVGLSEGMLGNKETGGPYDSLFGDLIKVLDAYKTSQIEVTENVTPTGKTEKRNTKTNQSFLDEILLSSDSEKGVSSAHKPDLFWETNDLESVDIQGTGASRSDNMELTNSKVEIRPDSPVEQAEINKPSTNTPVAYFLEFPKRIPKTRPVFTSEVYPPPRQFVSCSTHDNDNVDSVTKLKKRASKKGMIVKKPVVPRMRTHPLESAPINFLKKPDIKKTLDTERRKNPIVEKTGIGFGAAKSTKELKYQELKTKAFNEKYSLLKASLSRNCAILPIMRPLEEYFLNTKVAKEVLHIIEKTKDSHVLKKSHFNKCSIDLSHDDKEFETICQLVESESALASRLYACTRVMKIYNERFLRKFNHCLSRDALSAVSAKEDAIRIMFLSGGPKQLSEIASSGVKPKVMELSPSIAICDEDLLSQQKNSQSEEDRNWGKLVTGTWRAIVCVVNTGRCAKLSASYNDFKQKQGQYINRLKLAGYKSAVFVRQSSFGEYGFFIFVSSITTCF